ncbi:S-4TM family putative pore-forming effector [Erysipelothrix aquatica]|uniref:S-4TM family putative pore-forming effector n=1 Tax=Erysipelothrix aquatica TaxID=2683714 RepID=UPI00135A24F1|nr:S-4TM family putative pore-forming effector [Erysipelothrix aquatica]
MQKKVFNTIFERQNEEGSLKVQAAARYMFNKANLIDNYYWVAILFFLVLKLVVRDNIYIDLILIAWFGLTIYIEEKIAKLTSIAANYKQIFDLYVYGWTDNISSITLEEITKIQKRKPVWFAEQVTREGNDHPRGVRSWYETVENDTDQLDAIKKAMKESTYYTNFINKIHYSVFLIIIVVTIGIFALGNQTVSDYLKIVFLTMAPISKKIISVLIKLERQKQICLILAIELKRELDNDELKDLQNLIFSRRQISGISPSWIYNVTKRRITDSING